MTFPNFLPGMIFIFDCCCEGKGITWNNLHNKYMNQDEQDVAGKNNHPFLILSSKDRNSSENYLTALPITSSSSFYNNQNSIKIQTDMVNAKAQSLVVNNSFLKVGSPTRIFKNKITLDKNGQYFYVGDFYPTAISSIKAEIAKKLG